MSEKIIYLSDASFDNEVLAAEGPVLVDFWAEWCSPCKALAPLLDEAADEFDGKIKITKLDVSANQQTAPKYGIRNIPTLMIFKKGELVSTKVGGLSKSQLRAFIEANL